MTRKQQKCGVSISSGVAIASVLTALILLSGWSCQQAKSAAVAVNRYGESLSHFQDAEITAHTQGKVDDDTHERILKAEKVAAQAGHNLDAAISIANSGGDPTQYVDVAQKAYNDLIGLVNSTNQQNLIVLGQAAGDLLKNAISLIRTIKPQPKPAPGTWMFVSFGVLGFAAAGVGLFQAIQLLTLITALEPVAFDLLLKLAQSLQGKSTEEVLALNEQLFTKVETTADEELKKLADKTPPTS